MKTFIYTILILALTACSSKSVAGGEPNNGSNNGNGNGNNNETPAPTPNPTPAPGSLIADGKTDTYQLILDSGYNYETPDHSGAHADDPFTHIKQSWDKELGKYVFDFYIHIENDDDRGKPNITDRQRNEIKTDAKSPDFMVAKKGESHTYTWKFRLPEGMLVTRNFCHIHQLKGYGGDDIGDPLISICVCLDSKLEGELQLRYYRPEKEGMQYLKRIPLDDFLGEWVEVTETAVYDYGGDYHIKITRISDNKVLLEENLILDLWRYGATAMRPKYGIYRSFGKEGSLKPTMRDEILKYADFTLEHKKAPEK